MFLESNIKGVTQNYTTLSFRNGCDWNTTYKFIIPADWENGFYKVKLSNSLGENYIYFVIKQKIDKSKTLLIVNTNTWQAYNNWGGGSFYQFLNDTNSSVFYSPLISYERPNNSIMDNHLTKGEILISSWLKINNYEIRKNSNASIIGCRNVILWAQQIFSLV